MEIVGLRLKTSSEMQTRSRARRRNPFNTDYREGAKTRREKKELIFFLSSFIDIPCFLVLATRFLASATASLVIPAS